MAEERVHQQDMKRIFSWTSRWTYRQIKAVLFVKGKGKITNKNIQELFKVSRETATRDLIFLLEKDILLSSGSKGAGAYYVLK